MPLRPARNAAKTASEKPTESPATPTPAGALAGKAAGALVGKAAGLRRGTVKLVVDGETFLVRRRPGARGIYDFDWISGRNRDYGFTTAVHGASPLSEDQLREEIREFLGQTDPGTGYLPD